MEPAVEIDGEVPDSIKADVRRVARQLQERGGRVREVRLHHEDLGRVLNKLVQVYRFPFRPTLCGFPVGFSEKGEIEVIAVRDDNTTVSVGPTLHESEA